MSIDNFLDAYKKYTKDAALISPPQYHEWCGYLAISSMLGRRLWVSRGPFKVFSNLYVMLMGEPGTGKGIAVAMLQSLLKDAMYEHFAADRSSKEMFLQDLADGFTFNKSSVGDLFANATFDKSGDAPGVSSEPRECLILAEEFQDFLGQNNLDFIALLTKLWSYDGIYRYRLKTGRSVAITDPCINLLGGSTSATFALTFPPEIAGQGFLARIILIGGEPTGTKISFPKAPDESFKSELAGYLATIGRECHGQIQLSEKEFIALDALNQEFGGVDDPRFKDYNTRRFSQLLKLTICNAAARLDTSIKVSDVERANSTLVEAEKWMPKALGSFGSAKSAIITNKILHYLYSATAPVTTKQLWRLVCDDLDKYEDLGTLLAKLAVSDRIQAVGGGWLPKLIAIKGGK